MKKKVEHLYCSSRCCSFIIVAASPPKFDNKQQVFDAVHHHTTELLHFLSQRRIYTIIISMVKSQAAPIKNTNKSITKSSTNAEKSLAQTQRSRKNDAAGTPTALSSSKFVPLILMVSKSSYHYCHRLNYPQNSSVSINENQLVIPVLQAT